MVKRKSPWGGPCVRPHPAGLSLTLGSLEAELTVPGPMPEAGRGAGAERGPALSLRAAPGTHWRKHAHPNISSGLQVRQEVEVKLRRE